MNGETQEDEPREKYCALYYHAGHNGNISDLSEFLNNRAAAGWKLVCMNSACSQEGYILAVLCVFEWEGKGER